MLNKKVTDREYGFLVIEYLPRIVAELIWTSTLVHEPDIRKLKDMIQQILKTI